MNGEQKKITLHSKEGNTPPPITEASVTLCTMSNHEVKAAHLLEHSSRITSTPQDVGVLPDFFFFFLRKISNLSCKVCPSGWECKTHSEAWGGKRALLALFVFPFVGSWPEYVPKTVPETLTYPVICLGNGAAHNGLHLSMSLNNQDSHRIVWSRKAPVNKIKN